MLIGFAQKVRCERPPAAYAALPLFKGENALVDIAVFIVPLAKGDGRRPKREADRPKHQEKAAGGRSHDQRKDGR